MKAITYLKQIKIIDNKIDAEILEIARLETLAEKTTAAMDGERVQSSGSQQKMADCVVKILSVKDQLAEDIENMIKLKDEVRKLISEECDADCCKLLHKRYFLYCTWEQIAVDMNFTYKWVSGGLHQRALAQVQKALDERGE